MGRKDLEYVLNRVPCPLLRLHMTGGTVFEIDDADMVALGRSTIELILPPNEAGQREAVINLLHIIWVEVLPPRA